MTRILTFGNIRRAILTALGVLVAGKGYMDRSWFSVLLGLGIIAYGLYAPG
jgi:hypothetical protein